MFWIDFCNTQIKSGYYLKFSNKFRISELRVAKILDSWLKKHLDYMQLQQRLPN